MVELIKKQYNNKRNLEKLMLILNSERFIGVAKTIRKSEFYFIL